MHASWRIFVDAASDRSACVLLARGISKTLGVQPEIARVEPYHKGGFVLAIDAAVPSASWPDAVVKLLGQAQQLGRGWELFGSILEELDAWSTSSSVAGVQAIHLQCQREEA